MNPMRITLDRDETGEVRVFCTMCARIVGPCLNGTRTEDAFDVLLKHVGNGHDGAIEYAENIERP